MPRSVFFFFLGGVALKGNQKRRGTQPLPKNFCFATGGGYPQTARDPGRDLDLKALAMCLQGTDGTDGNLGEGVSQEPRNGWFPCVALQRATRPLYMTLAIAPASELGHRAHKAEPVNHPLRSPPFPTSFVGSYAPDLLQDLEDDEAELSVLVEDLTTRRWGEFEASVRHRLDMGLSVFRGPPEWWFSFWLPFTTHKNGCAVKTRHTHMTLWFSHVGP